MRNTVRKFLKTAGKRVGFKKLYWHIYGLLQEPDVTQLKVFDIFTDSHGNHIELLSGLRDSLKPDWQSMLCPVQSLIAVPSRGSLVRNMEKWRNKLNRVENFFGAISSSFVGKDILEIGAYDGGTAYALASLGANRVLATDMAAYYITQTPGGEVSEEAIAAKNRDLSRLRDTYAKVVSEQVASRVSFQEDDICASSVPYQSMDVVVSWEVLEHLTQPQDAFREIARILKPGGLAFHEYNPFFSLNGGHSLCTLDFPWGHARLDDRDFERYLAKIRPNERAIALSFYQNNLNRMTLLQLTRYMEQAGLTPQIILPWPSKDHLSLVTSEALIQCKHVHPTARLTDLISPIVWVLFTKNSSSEVDSSHWTAA